MKRSFPRRQVLAVCLCLVFFGGAQVTPALSAAKAALPDPLVAGMLAQVQQQALVAYTGGLSGEWPVWVDGGKYVIPTRSTLSGQPIQKATQYVYDHLQAWGLAPSFDDWSSPAYSGRNVIGVLPGKTNPSEIVLLTAHVDDYPRIGRAPGADDNTSGSVGVLLAAEILGQYRFARTVRFVLFTGEEQGLYGSNRYAVNVSGLGENIVAVCNLDMIGWNALDGPVARLHTQISTSANFAKELAIAQMFVDVVTAYGLGLQPLIVSDGMTRSDHASFWYQGYPAILAIEDDHDDFSHYYHSTGDRLNSLDLDYFQAFVKAAVGTVAHLAGPLALAVNTHSARIDPPAAMQWGEPADEIDYSVRITNTGSLVDSYTLTATGNAWTTLFPVHVGPLAAGESLDVGVTVSIPPDSPGGAADITTLTATSSGTGTGLDTVELTTAAHWKMIYLPIIRR